jgi:hypothetical protein
MKKSIIFISIILVFSIKMNAQSVPGYQGKRTYLEYNSFLTPTLLGINVHGKKFGVGDKRSLLAFSVRHKINMNYVTKRNAEVGGSLSFGKTGVLDDNDWLGEIRFSSLGFNYNRYFIETTGALAPLGRYARVEVQYLQAASLFINEQRLDYHFAYIGGGIGNRMVISDFFTINLSFQSGLVLPLKINNSPSHDEFRNTVRKRMQFHYLYETNIGIGVLIF